LNKIPVFDILERNGRVNLEIVPNITAETLLTLTIKIVKKKSLIYTDCYRSYDGLVALDFKLKRVEQSKTFVMGRFIYKALRVSGVMQKKGYRNTMV